MRNYISTKLREQVPRLRKEIENRYEQQASQFRQFTNLVAVRGVIEGPGLVSNSYVFGTLQIEEGAEFINSTIDYGVTVILKKGAKLFNCRFKGISIGNNNYAPYTVLIEEDNILIDSTITIPTTLGRCGRYAYYASSRRIDLEHSSDGSIRIDKPAITIGDNALMCSVFIKAECLSDTNEKHLVIGNNALMNSVQLTFDSKVMIGEAFTGCDYDYALRLTLTGQQLEFQEFPNNEPDFEAFIANTALRTRISLYPNVSAGDNLYIGTPVTWHTSFPKLKTPNTVTIGNNVVFVGQNSEHRVKACTHTAVIGDNTTIVGDATAQYCDAQVLRNLQIGSDSCVILGTAERNFSGTDKYVRSRTTTKI